MSACCSALHRRADLADILELLGQSIEPRLQNRGQANTSQQGTISPKCKISKWTPRTITQANQDAFRTDDDVLRNAQDHKKGKKEKGASGT